MAHEINELLDYNKIGKVHGVSHDWGTFLLSQLASYFPKRFASYSFLATTYTPPGQDLHIDALNLLTKKKLGFEMYGYWKFFEKEDAAQITKEHVGASTKKDN